MLFFFFNSNERSLNGRWRLTQKPSFKGSILIIVEGQSIVRRIRTVVKRWTSPRLHVLFFLWCLFFQVCSQTVLQETSFVFFVFNSDRGVGKKEMVSLFLFWFYYKDIKKSQFFFLKLLHTERLSNYFLSRDFFLLWFFQLVDFKSKRPNKNKNVLMCSTFFFSYDVGCSDFIRRCGGVLKKNK